MGIIQQIKDIWSVTDGKFTWGVNLLSKHPNLLPPAEAGRVSSWSLLEFFLWLVDLISHLAGVGSFHSQMTVNLVLTVRKGCNYSWNLFPWVPPSQATRHLYICLLYSIFPFKNIVHDFSQLMKNVGRFWKKVQKFLRFGTFITWDPTTTLVGTCPNLLWVKKRFVAFVPHAKVLCPMVRVKIFDIIM